MPKVDFISAPGTSPPNVYRPGGPIALVTNRCVFGFDRSAQAFRLASVHPGHTVEEVIEHTGFAFDCPARCRPRRRRPPRPCARSETWLRPSWPKPYPKFVAAVFGIAQRRAS